MAKRSGKRRVALLKDGSMIDTQTGDPVNPVIMDKSAPKPRSPFVNWYGRNVEADRILAIRGNALGVTGFRVLNYMTSSVQQDNLIEVSQTEIAEALSLHRQNVSRAMKCLVEMNLLIKGRVRGVYRLSPHLGWRGNPLSHRKAINDLNGVVSQTRKDSPCAS